MWQILAEIIIGAVCGFAAGKFLKVNDKGILFYIISDRGILEYCLISSDKKEVSG